MNNILKPISAEEVARAQVEGNLPDKPSQAPLYGGRPLSPREIKAWYDKLPKLIISYYNRLIESIPGVKNGAFSRESLAAKMLTNIRSDHTLRDLFSDILTGAAAEYLRVSEDTTLAELFTRFQNQINMWGDTIPTEPAEFGTIYAKLRSGEIDSLYMYLPAENGVGRWVKMGQKGIIRTDETLSFKDGVLSVNTASKAILDNHLPITSDAVAVSIGNIEIYLKTI